MKIYTVSFNNHGYIQELNDEEYKKIEHLIGKDVWLLSVTSWDIYVQPAQPIEQKKPNNKSKWDRSFK